MIVNGALDPITVLGILVGIASATLGVCNLVSRVIVRLNARKGVN